MTFRPTPKKRKSSRPPIRRAVLLDPPATTTAPNEANGTAGTLLRRASSLTLLAASVSTEEEDEDEQAPVAGAAAEAADREESKGGGGEEPAQGLEVKEDNKGSQEPDEDGGLDEDALLEAQAVSSAVAQAHAAARELVGSETHTSFAGGTGIRRNSSNSLLAASGAVVSVLPKSMVLLRHRWLAVALPLLLALWVLLPSALKSHSLAFLAPFLLDNAFLSPTAARTAQKVLTQSFSGGPHPWQGQVAIVTGCTMGGVGADTAAALAGVGGMQVR